MHALDLAANLDRIARLELFLQFCDDLADLFGDAAEIAVLHAGVDVVSRLDVRLIQIGRDAVAGELGDVAQEPRHRRTCGGDFGRNRRVADFAERAHLMLRRLDRNVIGNSRCRIGPEVRRHLRGRAQAYIDVIGDALRVQPELQSTRTIDRGHERRTIDLLLKMRVDNSRNCGNAPLYLLRYAQVGRAVPADGPDVDLRRQSEIEDLGDHVGSLKIE